MKKATETPYASSTTTLHGEQKEKQKDVNTIHRQSRNMLANSLVVIGHSWYQDSKRRGKEPVLKKQTDRDAASKILPLVTESRNPVFDHPVPLKEES